MTRDSARSHDDPPYDRELIRSGSASRRGERRNEARAPARSSVAPQRTCPARTLLPADDPQRPAAGPAGRDRRGRPARDAGRGLQCDGLERHVPVDPAPRSAERERPRQRADGRIRRPGTRRRVPRRLDPDPVDRSEDQHDRHDPDPARPVDRGDRRAPAEREGQRSVRTGIHQRRRLSRHRRRADGRRPLDRHGPRDPSLAVDRLHRLPGHGRRGRRA